MGRAVDKENKYISPNSFGILEQPEAAVVSHTLVSNETIVADPPPELNIK